MRSASAAAVFLTDPDIGVPETPPVPRNGLRPVPGTGAADPLFILARTWPGSPGEANLRRAHLGGVVAEMRHAALTPREDLRVTTDAIFLVTPVDGAAEIAFDGGRLMLRKGEVGLVARSGGARVLWSPGARGLVTLLRRSRLQAAASAIVGDARRLASVNLRIDRAPIPTDLDLALAAVVGLMVQPSAMRSGDRAAEARFYDGLARRLTETELSAVFPVARAVTRAMAYVREHPQARCDAESLAAVAGVTALTLRKGFRSSLGATVTHYVQSTRLNWARDRLASGLESRPISELAAAAGFRDAPSFSRAYLKVQGESPSQTRARAVRDMG